MVSGKDGEDGAVYGITYSEDDDEITEVDIRQLQEDLEAGSLLFI